MEAAKHARLPPTPAEIAASRAAKAALQALEEEANAREPDRLFPVWVLKTHPWHSGLSSSLNDRYDFHNITVKGMVLGWFEALGASI